MKRPLAMLLVSVCVLCLVAACGERAEPGIPSVDAAPSVEPSPTSSPSPTPSPTPTAKPTPTPEPKVELLGYDEYFAEEREIEAPPFERYKDIPFTTADDDWHKIVRTRDNYVVAEGTTGGCAVVVDKDGCYREVAFAKDNKLYITEDNGETPIVVYEATEKLRPIFFSDDPVSGVVLGFVDGTRRYRLYVPTRTVDFMFDLPDVPWWADVKEEHGSAEWWGEEHPDYGVHIGGEGLLTNQTWVCACYGDNSWGKRYADIMDIDYETAEFDYKVPLFYDSISGKWRTQFDGSEWSWVMDALGIPEELRVHDTELMSYEEYFSEERKLENIVYESPMYDDQWENGKIYLRSSGEVLAERPERWDVIEGKGGASDELLIYDDKRIYITENCGRDRLLVFEAESEIEPVHNPAPSTLFTFIDSTKRYRIYTPTCTVDFMFDLPGVLTEAEMTELWRVGKLPDDALYVWTEELVDNHTWQVQIAGQSDEWVAALAAYEGVTVEEFVNTDGASWRVSVYYDSQSGEWELTKKAEFVRDFVELG